MQTCSNCGAQQLDGTIFCSECGSSLMGENLHQETTVMPYQRGINRPSPQPPHPNVGASSCSKESVLALIVLSTGQRLTIDLRNEILIGREDRAKTVRPDIDLSLYGGKDAGVSRRHALLSMNSETYMVEDIGSANGTFLNGQRVPPHQPISISNGDELSFGTLLVRVECG